MIRALLAVLGLTIALGGCSTGPAESGSSSRASASAEPTSFSSLLPAPDVTASSTPTLSPEPRQSRTPATGPSPVVDGSYVYPIRGCTSSYGRSHHDYPASDIFAKRGCVIVSVVSGRVDEVRTVDRWNSKENDGATRGGLSVSVVGDDGVRYYYSHFDTLADVARVGSVVAAGAPLGTVGNSGSARGTAPHVHFGLSWPTGPGIWWVRRGMVQPAGYLDAWKVGRDYSPAAAVSARRREVGDVPKCTSAC